MPFNPMKSAVNEAIATRLPARVDRRVAAITAELGAQAKTLAQSFTTLPAEFEAAFAAVDAMLNNVAAEGPKAVTAATRSALDSLEQSKTQLRSTVEAARAATEAALVRQHDAARTQLVEGAGSRARNETQVAEKRAERDMDAATALAGGQGKAVRAVIASLEQKRDRPAAQFATAAIGAADGLKQRIAELSSEQTVRLDRTAAEGRSGLDRQSDATGGQLANSAQAMARAPR